jgi:uncharacterized lipoprotein YmbA
MYDRHMFKLLVLAMATLALAACTGTDIRFASTQIEPSTRIASRYASLEVVEVTLPVYAASEEIFTEDASGAITALGPLWADDPARAMTLQLSRDLAAITGATVAPEPWPFRGIAEAKVDVRIEEMLATASGTFRVSGQFFVAPDISGPDRSGLFSISVPLPAQPSPSRIAAARGAATSSLAEEIVNRALR